jgi:hypothetical protein
MDFSIVLSIVALFVSVILSAVTLLITQFQGPDITLISSPQFEISDDIMVERLKYWMLGRYTPNWLESNTTPFVFANHGGKAGTILSIHCQFVPTPDFSEFLNSFRPNFRIVGEQESYPIIITIEQGDNKTINTQFGFGLIDWKRKALAEVLNPTSRIDDQITVALQRSKQSFAKLCDLISKSERLGTVDCTISFTKGRFRTKVTTQHLLRNAPVQNNLRDAAANLRKFLEVWEKLEPRASELLNETKGELEGIMQELKDDLYVLSTAADEPNILMLRPRMDHWKQFSSAGDSCQEAIRWFLIQCDSKIKESLTKLYDNVERFDSLINTIAGRGAFRTSEDLRTIDEERSKLIPEIQTTLIRLSELHSHLVP